MSKVQFRILCPNGKKVNIKTEPQKPLLLLIEEACQKQGYIPENYDLKHLRRILDPTSIVRYANIPNNAQLELVETTIPRQSSAVSVTLAISSGKRLVHDFSSNSTLWEILMHHSEEFSSEEALTMSEEAEPIIVYTLQKINGEKLKSTSLKSLGLISGKCLLRYSKQKIRKEGECQPHVSSVMNPRKVCAAEDNDDNVKHTEIKTTCSITSHISTNAAQTVISSLNTFRKSGNSSKSDSSTHVTPKQNTLDRVHDCEMEINTMQEDKMKSVDNNISKENSEFKLIPLCESGAFLFSEDDIPSNNFFNEDDSFFEVSMDEVKKRYKELVNMRTELENEPLLTGRVRELEKNRRMLSTLNCYPVTHLRICFPDRYVIQASFKPHNTVTDVMQFLRQFLMDTSLEFYLYTLFPRKKLKPESNLVEANCIPKARIYFGSDQKAVPFLKMEVLAKKSTLKAVSMVI